MTVEYKVWVHVERIDSELGAEGHENIGNSDNLATYTKKENAFAYVRSLPGWESSLTAETSDYRDVGRMCRCGSGEKEHYAIGAPLGDIQRVCPGQLEDIDTFTTDDLTGVVEEEGS